MVKIFTRRIWIILAIVMLLIAVSMRLQISTKTVQAKDILEQSLQTITVPKAGEIAHYSYEVSIRAPDKSLEPSDPYHKPYSEIWLEKSFEDTWLEIDENGNTIRWRTQQRNANGDLLQDLLFDGKTEMDYFVAEGRAMTYQSESPISQFRDDRVALIQDFLNRSDLESVVTSSSDGHQVLSVYAKAITLPQNATEVSVEQSLAQLNSPFTADLHGVELIHRIDFDRDTSLPVGEGDVIRDKDGNEHVIRYRKTSLVKTMPANTKDAENLFNLQVPQNTVDNALQFTPKTTFIQDWKQIVKAVDYPLYSFAMTVGQLHLSSTSLAILEDKEIPKYLQNIDFTANAGIAVDTLYVSQDSSSTVNILQGSTESMKMALRNTIPTWTHAEIIQTQVGDKIHPVWILTGPDNSTARYIVELDETLLYLQTQDIENSLVHQILASASKNVQSSNTIFMPLVQN